MTSRLRIRFVRLEQAIQSKGRLFVVRDDGAEEIEQRIARCKAETHVTLADLVVIITSFGEPNPEMPLQAHWRDASPSALEGAADGGVAKNSKRSRSGRQSEPRAAVQGRNRRTPADHKGRPACS